MKTIVLLALAGMPAWPAATAQTPFGEEAPPLESVGELANAHEANNTWFPDFKSYARENLRYPEIAREAGTEGVVQVEATVCVDGELTDFEIVEGLNSYCDKEVIRMLSEMPAWNPARRNGKPVEQRVHVHVRFQLNPF